jgi:hypothetical protein
MLERKTKMERKIKKRNRGSELVSCMREHAVERDICRVVIRICDAVIVGIEQSQSGKACFLQTMFTVCAVVR